MTKKRGRPPVDPADRLVTFSVRVSPPLYDQIWRSARQQRMSMSDLVRLSTMRTLRQTAPPKKS